MSWCLHLLMTWVVSNNIWEENCAKALLVIYYEGIKTKQDSNRACFKQKSPIPIKHKLFFKNFLINKFFYQLWEGSGSIFVLQKISDDTLISTQSWRRNTTSQALISPTRKLEKSYKWPIQSYRMKWNIFLNWMGSSSK